MTLFEHYTELANLAKDSLANTAKVFMLGEVIDITPPYLVVDISYLGNIGQQQEALLKIMCFGENRGKTHKLLSNVKSTLQNKKGDNITIAKVEADGAITQYNDSLYCGVLKTKTRSMNDNCV